MNLLLLGGTFLAVNFFFCKFAFKFSNAGRLEAILASKSREMEDFRLFGVFDLKSAANSIFFKSTL